uniref:Uncharacterized protein n=1 Tax=Panagrolaimus superbus TaxID=310955 RepID=A0A914YR91_9BILA
MYTNEGGYSNQNSRECSQQSRICFYNHHDCFGKTKQNDICDADVFNDPNTNRKYFDYHIIVKKNKAIIKSQAGDAEFEIANISPIYDNKYPELKIAVVSFYKNNHGIHDCSDPSNPKCQHTDSLYILTRPNNPNKGQIPNQNGGGNNGNAEIIESTTPNFLTSPLSPVKSTEAASNAGFTAVYIIVGIVVAIALIIILLCILRCYQGIWCCGLLCCKKEETEEENIKKKYKFTGSKEVNQGSGSNDKPGDVEKGKNGEEVVQQQKSGDLKVSFQGREFLQTTQPTQTHTTLTEDQKKPLEEVVVAKKKEEKKDEKTSKSSSSSAAAAAETKDKEKEKTTKPQKRAQAPNMLLLATREDETQSEARSPSKRKTKVEKNNKEPPPTKNVTQDAGAPTTKGIATGKAATTMKATAIARTEAAKTGLPKSETELVTDEKAPGPATKGVSATQGDKTTAAKGTTKVAPTQTYVGTQTTQGGATTAGGKTKKTQETGMITGVGKTRLTGATQMPTADTNETQNPTGATKTKPTQFATGATQRLTTGTTQAGTGK